MSETNSYKYLGPREGSAYKQWFVRGTRIRAEVLDRARFEVDERERTPEEVAEDYDVPVEAVRECIRYCQENEALLRQEREADLADMRRRGLFDPPLVPPWYKPETDK